MAIHKVKTTTQNGEITVNINLQVELVNGTLAVHALPGEENAHESKGKIKLPEQSRVVDDVVPDELFDELPLVNNFGDGAGKKHEN